MTELSFTMGLQASKGITIIINDEGLFKKKYKEFYKGEKSKIDFYDLQNSFFEDCVEVEYGYTDWEDEDVEGFDDLIEDFEWILEEAA